MKYSLLFFILLSSQIACLNKPKGKVVFQNFVENNSLDLLALKASGVMKSSKEVQVFDDPVYHKSKRYQAWDLIAILKEYLNLEIYDPAETKIVFECEDGYKPEMSLEKLLSASSFIAFKDLDAPSGRDWEKIEKDGHEMKAEPFYIIYTDVSAKDYEYKWPYNVIKIHLAPLHENDEALVPKDIAFINGYKLFAQSCQICHAINNIGGNMGPELNTPKSVTSYWKKEDLIAFIADPASYRNNVKMPKPNITIEQSAEIVAYLEFMAGQK